MELQVFLRPSKDRILVYNYRAMEDGAGNRNKNSREHKGAQRCIVMERTVRMIYGY